MGTDVRGSSSRSMKIVDIETKQTTQLSFEMVASVIQGEWSDSLEVKKVEDVLAAVETEGLIAGFSVADTDLILDEADNYLVMQGMSEYYSVK